MPFTILIYIPRDKKYSMHIGKSRALASFLLLMVLILPSIPSYEGGAESWETGILIIYDSLLPESVIAADVLKWAYSTMWKIPVELLDSSRTRISPELFFNPDSSPRFSLIFLLSLIDGKDRFSPSEWSTILEKVDGNVPIISLGYSVNLPQASLLFGCEQAKVRRVENVRTKSDPLTEGIPRNWRLSREEIVARVIYGESLISVSGEEGLTLYSRYKKNLWLGIVEIARGSFPSLPPALSLLGNILDLAEPPLVRFMIPYRFVGIRLDDIPFSTESWFWGWEYFTAREWRRFFETLRRHSAKVNLMIVPFNVSKDTGAWVPYNLTHPREVEEIRKAVREGIVEVGDHGATHVNPFQEGFIRAEGKDPMYLTSKIRFEFGYDPNSRRRIPFELQLYHIRAGTKAIEEWFGVRPIVFTPPWHVWDNSTEKALKELGYAFLSADFRFRGGELGQPPSITGEVSGISGLLYVPVTHSWGIVTRGDPNSVRYSLDPFFSSGIPVVFIDHGRNWTFGGHTTVFSISGTDRALTLLDKLYSPRYATISEIGTFLLLWRNLTSRFYWEENVLRVVLRSDHNLEALIDIPQFTGAYSVSVNENELKGNLVKISKGETIVEIRFSGELQKAKPGGEVLMITQLYIISAITIVIAGSLILIIIRSGKSKVN